MSKLERVGASMLNALFTLIHIGLDAGFHLVIIAAQSIWYAFWLCLTFWLLLLCWIWIPILGVYSLIFEE